MSATEVIQPLERPAQPGLARRRRVDLLRDPLALWCVCLALLLLIVLVVLPAIVSGSPTRLNAGAPLDAPSGAHWFGTDQNGRDVATRVLYGARLSALVAGSTALLVLLIGGVLGATAASGPRWLGELIMRAMDVGMAFPGILLAIVLAAAIGPSLTTTVIVLVVIYTPSMTRVVRAAVFNEFGEDYVTAARLIGTRPIRLVGYHVGVNAALPVIVYATIVMADSIVAEAALSFLGAGIKAPAPSWGNIIHDGQTVVAAGAWWVSLFPGIAIVLTVILLNRFSEAIGRRLRAR
ncbi:MAG: peptide/nickel transport system ATP-binding protein [Solirubrobacteraceae bacterium]